MYTNQLDVLLARAPYHSAHGTSLKRHGCYQEQAENDAHVIKTP